eukprot:scaffold75164_cov33-Tisochrysis_lutea.AAC.5
MSECSKSGPSKSTRTPRSDTSLTTASRHSAPHRAATSAPTTTGALGRGRIDRSPGCSSGGDDCCGSSILSDPEPRTLLCSSGSSSDHGRDLAATRFRLRGSVAAALATFSALLRLPRPMLTPDSPSPLGSPWACGAGVGRATAACCWPLLGGSACRMTARTARSARSRACSGVKEFPPPPRIQLVRAPHTESHTGLPLELIAS